jgi:hypothetical protein
MMTAYFEHYHRWRCHQGLAMDCPEPRPIQGREQGAVVEVAASGQTPLLLPANDNSAADLLHLGRDVLVERDPGQRIAMLRAH